LAAAKSWRRAARRDAIASRRNNAAGLGFPRDARLVRRGEFDAVYRGGKRRSSSNFTVFCRANHLPASRFGFSIKKTLGGAVLRNRIRRRVREIIRLHRQELPPGWDIVIHPKSGVARGAFAALTTDLLHLLREL